jgi:CO dehydrogenase nickel-insertion accessory protein CooC1
MELSDSFGIKTRNTIYGIKSGKHEYKTGIPEGMSKQEYIEWALEDIIIEIDENVDMIASWFITPKDCNCPSTKLMRDSLSKLIPRYDFVIFDCEYDLKYLNSLVDCPVDEAIIVSTCDKNNIALSAKIAESSRKYVYDGQLGIILNKIEKEKLNTATELLNSFELNLLGYLKEYEKVDCDEMINSLEVIYSRMNLPQIEG